jgi:phosphoribosylanthranilate isomerase
MPIIKICGISNLRDALAAADSGADALGFICDPGSPRYVSPELFCRIHSELPSRIKRVGVFHHGESPEWSHCENDVIGCFDRIQYGDDNVWMNVFDCTVDYRRKIKIFPLQRTADLLMIAAYGCPASAYLVNVHINDPNGNSDEYGWHLARQVHQFGKRIYLAGGLVPGNVATAISYVLPFAVDVNVGVETCPGEKDHTKMRDFIQAARAGIDKTDIIVE